MVVGKGYVGIKVNTSVGPFKTKTAAMQAKARLQNKYPVSVTAPRKTIKGYYYNFTITYKVPIAKKAEVLKSLSEYKKRTHTPMRISTSALR